MIITILLCCLLAPLAFYVGYLLLCMAGLILVSIAGAIIVMVGGIAMWFEKKRNNRGFFANINIKWPGSGKTSYQAEWEDDDEPSITINGAGLKCNKCTRNANIITAKGIYCAECRE